MRPITMQPKIESFANGLIVDNFAGGGGASTGIELALGRPVDIAINHDPDAIAMHEANHPFTHHYCESVWDIDPVEATAGRPVQLAWFSPDCTHFSKARGCKPVEKSIRGLAWIAVKWAAMTKSRVIMLENVEEIQSWGPLDENNYPIKEQAGETFEEFINALKKQGYDVDFRELRACDYGAPTIRKRFFLVARCDGEPIRWPEPTHGSGKIPYRTAAEIIDWTLPCPSIFDTSEAIKDKYGLRAVRPLSESTMKRIARGLKKFILESDKPFIMPWTLSDTSNSVGRTVDEQIGTATTATGGGQMLITPYVVSIGQTGFSADRSRSAEVPLNTIVSKAEQCLISPFLIQYHSESNQNDVRGQAVDGPLLTVDTSNRYGIVAANIIKFKHNDPGQAADEPLHTICASTVHFAEVRTFMIEKNGVADDNEAGTIVLNGVRYAIVDIGMRMLTPRELFSAQGFPSDYIIDYTVSGKHATKSAQVARCGNSVCPALAEALVRANLPEQCGRKIETMADLEAEFGVVS